MALGDRVRDEGVRGLQVEDVVLVDARRDDHQRALVDLRGGRRVLDQLDQLVLEDDGARRGADVAAHLERRLVGHRDPALGQVLGEQAHALDAGSRRRSPSRAAAPRGWWPACWPGSARPSPGCSANPHCALLRSSSGAASSALRMQVGLREVGPGDGLVARVLRPRLVGEAPVLDRLGRGRRRRASAPSTGAASVFSASSCSAVMSATALVHGAAAAVIAFAVSAMCRSGHITCSVDISSVSQRVGSGVGWDIRRSKAAGSTRRSCSATPAGA